MATLPASELEGKTIETTSPPDLSQEGHDPVVWANALITLVENSAKHVNIQHAIHAPMHRLTSLPILKGLIPKLEKLAAKYHFGNFVVVRGTEDKFFESMPLYAR